jgi:ribonuclease BN (tRNA processing enzyme)
LKYSTLYAIVFPMSKNSPPGTIIPAHSVAALENQGQLSLRFIGTGSAFTKKFYQTNLLVVKGQDHVLIDCGTRTPEALSRLGLSVLKVRNYLITHSHADHIGGLEEVMLMNRYVGKTRPAMIAPAKYRRYLWDKSLKGGAAYNERVNGKWLGFSDFWDTLDPVPVPGADRELSELQLGSIKLAMFRTRHIPDSAPTWRTCAPSYGVVIDDSILFTGDTRFDPGLLAFLEARYKLKAIFHDCQFFDGGVHASINELRNLPGETKARMWLVHYGDAVEAQADTIRNYGFAGFARQWEPYEYQ